MGGLSEKGAQDGLADLAGRAEEGDFHDDNETDWKYMLRLS